MHCANNKSNVAEAMIHHLVESLHGGFDTVNSFVRVAIQDALKDLRGVKKPVKRREDELL